MATYINIRVENLYILLELALYLLYLLHRLEISVFNVKQLCKKCTVRKSCNMHMHLLLGGESAFTASPLKSDSSAKPERVRGTGRTRIDLLLTVVDTRVVRRIYIHLTFLYIMLFLCRYFMYIRR